MTATATETIPAVVYGDVAGEWQQLGKVALSGERLHYRPTDGIPRRVLEQAKRGLLAGHARFRFTLAGVCYLVVGPDRPAPEVEDTRPQVRNSLTGVPLWDVTVKTNRGDKIMEFEAPTLADVEEMAKHPFLKLTVLKVEPKR